jgi:hypothetical protein
MIYFSEKTVHSEVGHILNQTEPYALNFARQTSGSFLSSVFHTHLKVTVISNTAWKIR